MESLPPADDGLEPVGVQVRRELDALRARCDEQQLSLADEILEHDGLTFDEWVRSLPS